MHVTLKRAKVRLLELPFRHTTNSEELGRVCAYEFFDTFNRFLKYTKNDHLTP